MVATFTATKTYDWPTTCGLVIFCAASVNLYSQVHVSITVNFDVYQELYFYNGMPLFVGLSKAGLVSNNIMDSTANASKI